MMRLPELFCGFPRRRSQGPTFYPVACSPQAWAAAAPLALIQSSLGLRFDVPATQISFHQPTLPHFLQSLTIRDLGIGLDKVDIMFDRLGDQVVVKPIKHGGRARIMTIA